MTTAKTKYEELQEIYDANLAHISSCMAFAHRIREAFISAYGWPADLIEWAEVASSMPHDRYVTDSMCFRVRDGKLACELQAKVSSKQDLHSAPLRIPMEIFISRNVKELGAILHTDPRADVTSGMTDEDLRSRITDSLDMALKKHMSRCF